MTRKPEQLPKSETHTRQSFHLPRELIGDLTRLAAELRARAVRDGGHSDNMSRIVEAALRAEIQKRRNALSKQQRAES